TAVKDRIHRTRNGFGWLILETGLRVRSAAVQRNAGSPENRLRSCARDASSAKGRRTRNDSTAAERESASGDSFGIRRSLGSGRICACQRDGPNPRRHTKGG